MSSASDELTRRLRALLYSRHAAAELPPATADPLQLLTWRVTQLERELQATRTEQGRIWWALLAALLIGAAVRVLV